MDRTKIMKDTIESILKIELKVNNRKKGQSNPNKDRFMKIIDNIEMAFDRSIAMHHDFGINNSEYDNLFFSTFDLLLEQSYNSEELDLINFYLYGRKNSDGTTNSLVLKETQEPVILENSEDLWYVLQELND